jgi:hypothetical protein
MVTYNGMAEPEGFFIYGEILPFGEEYFGTIILYQKFSIK